MHLFAELVVPTGAVAIHWFEQSTFALKDDQGTIVQLDPYYPHSRPGEKYIYAEPPLDESQLPTDYVLLTHDHSDHTNPESVEHIFQSFPEAHYVGPAESIQHILADTSVDADHTTIIQAGESVSIGSMTAHALYAKPPEGDPTANIAPPDVTHLGLVVEASGLKLYFSGDPINTFAEQDALVDAVAAHQPDLGFLTNHPTEGEFPFFDGSVKMAQRIGLKAVGPSHYECFVKRNYDPQVWAAQFPADGPQIVIIPRNSHIIYTGSTS